MTYRFIEVDALMVFVQGRCRNGLDPCARISWQEITRGDIWELKMNPPPPVAVEGSIKIKRRKTNC